MFRDSEDRNNNVYAKRQQILDSISDILLHIYSVRDTELKLFENDVTLDDTVKNQITEIIGKLEKETIYRADEFIQDKFRQLKKHNDIDTAIENIPPLNAALQVYIDNILAPDDITREVFKVAHIEGLIMTNYEQFIKRVISYLEFDEIAKTILRFRLLYGSGGIWIQTPTEKLKRFLQKNQVNFENTDNVKIETYIQLEREIDETEILESFKYYARKLNLRNSTQLITNKLSTLQNNIITEQFVDNLFDSFFVDQVDIYSQKLVANQAADKRSHKLILDGAADSIRVREILDDETIRDIRISFSIQDERVLTESINGTYIHSLIYEIRKLKKNHKIAWTSLINPTKKVILEQLMNNQQSGLFATIKDNLRRFENDKMLKTDIANSLDEVDLMPVHPSRFAPVKLSNYTIGYLVITKRGDKLEKPLTYDLSIDIVAQRRSFIANFEKQVLEQIGNILLNYLRNKDLVDTIITNDTTAKFLAKFLSMANSGSYEVIFVPAKYFVTLPVDADPETAKGIFDSVLFFAKLYYIGVISTQIYRLTRAPERFVYYVDVGMADKNMQVKKYLLTALQAIKSRPALLSPDTEMSKIPAYVGIFEDLFIPRYGGERSIDIETVQGGDLNARIEDIEHLLRQLLSGLGVPPALIGYSEEYELRSTLANQNIRFARTVISFQQELSKSFTELLHKITYVVMEHVYTHIASFYKLYLPPPRALMIAQLSEIARAAADIADAIGDITDKKLLLNWLIGDLFDITGYSIKQLELELQKKVEELLKKSEDEETGDNEEGGLTL